jgi:hypothetical protein
VSVIVVVQLCYYLCRYLFTYIVICSRLTALHFATCFSSCITKFTWVLQLSLSLAWPVQSTSLHAILSLTSPVHVSPYYFLQINFNSERENLSLFLIIKHYAMKSHCRVDPRINVRFLGLGTVYTWVVSFTPCSLYLRVKIHRYPMKRRIPQPTQTTLIGGKLSYTGTWTPTLRPFSQ